MLFSGDLVEYGATPYCGDAHFGDWPRTLDRAGRASGRGAGAGPRRSADTARQVERGHRADARLPRGRCSGSPAAGAEAGHTLKQVYDTAMRELRPRTATG